MTDSTRHAGDQITPTSLTVEQAAKLLGIGEARIRADIEAGLPTGPGGRLSLVTYAAWLLFERAARADRTTR